MNITKTQLVLKLFDSIVLIGPRQCGKTTELLISAIIYAAENPGHRIIIYSRYLRDLRVDQVRDIYASIVSNVTCYKESRNRLIFSNGAEIRFAATENDIRGSGAEYFIIDADEWMTMKDLNICLPLLLASKKMTIALFVGGKRPEIQEHILALERIKCILRL